MAGREGGQVLVGVDGSPGARAALRFALGLAAALGGSVRAMRAWQYPALAAVPGGPHALPSREELDFAIESELRAMVSEEQAAAAGGLLGEVALAPTVTVQVAHGDPAQALLQRANSGHVDAIVTGSRGLGGFMTLMLGSVARQVANHTPVPLVVVPLEAATGPLGAVLVGVDGSAGAGAALRWASSVAAGAGGRVVAAHTLSTPATRHDEAFDNEVIARAEHRLEREWCAPLSEAGVAHRFEVVRGDPRVALAVLADEIDAGLVVVGTAGRSGVARALLGSVATHLLQHSRRPVAVVPPATRARQPARTELGALAGA